MVINYLVGYLTWYTIPYELEVDTLSLIVVYSITELLGPYSYHYCLANSEIERSTSKEA